MATFGPRSACAAVAVAAAVGVTTTGACIARVDSEGYRAVEEHRFAVTERVEVRLITFDGEIDVRAWDRPEVHVEIVKRAGSREAVEAIPVVAQELDAGLVVEARRPAEIEAMLGMGGFGSARFRASVPPGVDLVARSGDGSVSVERVNGRVEMQTDDGDIRGVALGGEIIGATLDGSVQLDDVDGRVQLSSGDGRINVHGRVSGVQVETGDGSIRLRAEPGSVVEDDWEIWTGDGGIVVTLPDGLSADIDAETADDGVVRVSDRVTILEQGGRRAIRARIGDGGAVIRLRTADGSIRLRVR